MKMNFAPTTIDGVKRLLKNNRFVCLLLLAANRLALETLESTGQIEKTERFRELTKTLSKYYLSM
jgi:hypothetical protein